VRQLTQSGIHPARIRVLIVDDSAIVRGLIHRLLELEAGIEVVGMAFNGAMALTQAANTHPDIILLDIEMPEMDGITALPQLRKVVPEARILMVSTLTLRNAEISLKALSLGAADYIAKPTSRQDEQGLAQFNSELVRKIYALAPPISHRSALPHAPVAPKAASSVPPAILPRTTYPQVPVRALAIGSSTGGPQALSTIFRALAGRLPHLPIFITQHMPATFTTILAQQLSQVSGRECVEGKEGDIVTTERIYLAPGDYHMVPQKQGNDIVIRINKDPQVNFCRPAVDPMMGALVEIYGRNLLGIILTGMGSDGLGGARQLVAAGGTLVAQNEATSVVYGMPKAVVDQNLCSAVLPLGEIADYIGRACP
jgi:two-component system chemotaxis response regulator CheB